MIESTELKKFFDAVPCANYRICRKAVHFYVKNDPRETTIEYSIDKDVYGYFFRRYIYGFCEYTISPYQLFRNGNTNTWEHFATIEKAIDRFNEYLSKL